MRVLVTGGAGFVGSHLVRGLQEASHEVEILDDLSRGHRDVVTRLSAKLHEVDIRDAARLELVLAHGRFDAVVHAAAVCLVPESVARPELYWDVNLRGGLVLLEALRTAGCTRLVVSSTAAVYGQPDEGWIDEGTVRRPTNPYGASKLAFEIAVEEAARHGLRAARLRYFNAAGAHVKGDLPERHDPETHLVPRLIAAALRGTAFPLYGTDYAESPDGTCVRDLVHVEDLARAHVVALERLDTVAGQAINLGTGVGTSVQKAITVVEHVLGKRLAVERGPRRPGDPGRLVAKVDRAREVLGWKATRDVETIVRDAARALGA
jgi:UDP-glucose-4-epimerase GalE